MKVKASVIVFVAAAFVSTWRHDSYQIGLGIVSVILCAWLVHSFHTKLAKIAVLTVGSVVLAQLAVLVRRAILEEGLRTTMARNPVGCIVGDIVYGFVDVALSLYNSFVALLDAVFRSEYAGLEGLNYRFVIVGWLVVGLSACFLLKKNGLVER